MNVRLISYTVPAEGLLNFDLATGETLMVYIARVSNPENQNNQETGPKLINYLISKKHWSPFEMVDFTVEIVTSRAIAQQILRHRSFSFQEFSQRYSKATKFEEIVLRPQSAKNRQSSEVQIGFNPLIELTDEVSGKTYDIDADMLISGFLISAQEYYSKLIAAGVSKETARFILPATTQTTIYMKGSVRSWIHYLQIRNEAGTQLEHRLIAEEIKTIFKGLFPVISEALNF